MIEILTRGNDKAEGAVDIYGAPSPSEESCLKPYGKFIFLGSEPSPDREVGQPQRGIKQVVGGGRVRGGWQAHPRPV
jgi:hypothetical protein